MFKHNWAWIKLATYNSSTVLTRNLRNPRDYAPLKNLQPHNLKENMEHRCHHKKLLLNLYCHA